VWLPAKPWLQPPMGSVDHWENPYRNAPGASPFAILKDFVLGEDSRHGPIWAERGYLGPAPIKKC